MNQLDFSTKRSNVTAVFMKLIDQLSSIQSPREWEELCDACFLAEFGLNYQTVKSKKDNGMDGYIISEKRLIAKHCFEEKPSIHDKDKEIKKKIIQDLDKAIKVKLRREVSRWTFVTPYELTEGQLKFLEDEARKRGFIGSSLCAKSIEVILLHHKEIISKFPNLEVVDIKKDIGEVLNRLPKITKIGELTPKEQEADALSLQDKQNTSITHEKTSEKERESSEDLKKAQKLSSGERDKGNKVALRALLYSSTDKLAQMQCAMGLIQWYDVLSERPEEMIGICDRGVQLSKEANRLDLEAIFLVSRADFLSMQFCELDMNVTAQIKMGNAVGMPLINEADRKKALQQLDALDKAFKLDFSNALEKARQSGQAHIIATVLMKIGSAAGNRSIHLAAYGIQDRADLEKRICLDTLATAKNIYANIGDEIAVAYVLHAIANNLRFFGENEEAKILIDQVIETSQKLGDSYLNEGAKILKERIITGRIPDYVHGER